MAVGREQLAKSCGAAGSEIAVDEDWDSPDADRDDMRKILRRLEQLERHLALVTVGYDARAVLLVRLTAIAERMRPSPYSLPDPRPTVEQVRRRLMQALARPQGIGAYDESAQATSEVGIGTDR